MLPIEERRRRLQQCVAEHIGDGWRLVEQFDEVAVIAWGPVEREARRTLRVDEEGALSYKDPGKDYAPVEGATTRSSVAETVPIVTRPVSPLRAWLVVGGIVFGAFVVVGLLIAPLDTTPADLRRARELDARDKREREGAGATMERFLRIDQGMTKQEVYRILGGPGELQVESDSGGEIRQWRAVTGFGVLSVHFSDGRVISKSQAGLD